MLGAGVGGQGGDGRGEGSGPERAGPAGYGAPPARGRGPGVVVVHDEAGLDDDIREICDRLGREGFVARAPELSGLEPGPAGAALDAAVTGLLSDEATLGARIGVLGLGRRGGALALRASRRNPRVGAVVDLGGGPGEAELELSELAIPVLSICAERDPAQPAEGLEALRRRLADAGSRVELRVEAGVEPGFLLPGRPEVHDAAAAARVWADLLAFLRAELA